MLISSISPVELLNQLLDRRWFSQVEDSVGNAGIWSKLDTNQQNICETRSGSL